MVEIGARTRACARLLPVAHGWRLDAAGALIAQGLGPCLGKRNMEFVVKSPSSNSRADQVISTGGIWLRNSSDDA